MLRPTSLVARRTSRLCSLTEVFSRFLPAISLSGREVFRYALVQLARINESDLAEEAGLYLSSQQLRDLANFNFEIGNHTYSHANCRHCRRQTSPARSIETRRCWKKPQERR